MEKKSARENRALALAETAFEASGLRYMSGQIPGLALILTAFAENEIRLLAGRRQREVATIYDYIAEAARLSGCSWQCAAKHRADGDGGSFDKCCSSCQKIALALMNAANKGPQHITSDSETPEVTPPMEGATDVDRLTDALRELRDNP